MQSYDLQQDSICVQALATLKTRAKDDQGKTYWIYPNEEVVDDFERKHILEIRPLVTLAKNSKRLVLVFALLNREIIEAMWGQLIGSNGSRVMFEGAIYSYHRTQYLVLFERALSF